MKTHTLLAVAFLVSVSRLGYAAFEDRTAQLVSGMGGGAAAWGDFNNDTYPDLYVDGALWINNEGKGFTAATGYGAGVLGDFDNDGYLDLYTWGGGGKLYRSLAGKEFQHVPTPTLPKDTTGQKPNISLGACWSDHDNDGYLDLYVGGYEIWQPTDFPNALLRNSGGSSFTLTPGSALRARGVTACDFDQDGDSDIYVSNYRLQPNLLLLNDGKGGLTDMAGPYGVAGDPKGPFPHGHTIGSAWGDMNNDGHIDLFVGNFRHNWGDGSQDHAAFYENGGRKGNWRFTRRKQLEGADWQESYASPALGDYDNDGDLDLYFTTVYGGDNARLYRNDGGWQFSDVTAAEGLAGMPPTYQAAWGDFDMDGDLDLATGGKLYVNAGNANHWLKVRLEGDGKTVNRSAIGAQVRIRLDEDTVLARQVEAGTGQGNQNDLVLHFGLGARKEPVDLKILWPGGKTSSADGLAVDQLVKIPVGQGVQP